MNTAPEKAPAAGAAGMVGMVGGAATGTAGAADASGVPVVRHMGRHGSGSGSGAWGSRAWGVSGDRAAPEVTTFVGRADGAEVSVGVQQGAGLGRNVVLLRISSPLLDTLAGAYLGPDEAHRLAAALSRAALAAVGQPPESGFPPGDSPTSNRHPGVKYDGPPSVETCGHDIGNIQQCFVEPIRPLVEAG
jgi:hypothetical protein